MLNVNNSEGRHTYGDEIGDRDTKNTLLKADSTLLNADSKLDFSSRFSYLILPPGAFARFLRVEENL